MKRNYYVENIDGMKVLFEKEMDIPIIFNYDSNIAKNENVNKIFEDVFFGDECCDFFYERCKWDEDSPVEIKGKKIVFTMHPYIDFYYSNIDDIENYFTKESLVLTEKLPEKCCSIKDILNREGLRKRANDQIEWLTNREFEAYEDPYPKMSESFYW